MIENENSKEEIILALRKKCEKLELENAILNSRRHEYLNQLNLITSIARIVPPSDLSNAICEYIMDVIKQHMAQYQVSYFTSCLGCEEIKECIGRQACRKHIRGPEYFNCDKLETEYREDIIAALITLKNREANEKKIKFTFDITCIENSTNLLFSMNVSMGAELLLNLINNAFEAVEKLNERNRWVKLKIDDRMIWIMNPTENLADNVNGDGLFFTTKGEGHGYGLKNIKRIAEGYNLDMEIKTENMTFSVKLIEKRVK